jgi:Ser/Thr protein kinase RdoA (MazF antagonist)
VLAARYDHVAGSLARRGRPIASPWALGRSDERKLLVLEPMPGRRWADLDPGALPGALHRLGEGIAAVHDTAPPPGTPRFGRLDLARVARSADLVALARPDVADRLRRLAGRLRDGPPAGERAVLLHGDCHPKNALFDGDALALIDLDQSGTGPAAADIGSLLARLRRDEATGTAGSETLVAAFLAGYAAVRPLPSDGSLRWHSAAALVAEQAMRAVNRVNRPVLARLDHLLGAAERTLDHGATS